MFTRREKYQMKIFKATFQISKLSFMQVFLKHFFFSVKLALKVQQLFATELDFIALYA